MNTAVRISLRSRSPEFTIHSNPQQSNSKM